MSEDAPNYSWTIGANLNSPLDYGPAKTCRHCGAPLNLTPLPELRWAVRFEPTKQILAIFDRKQMAQEWCENRIGFNVEEIEVAEGKP